MNFKGKRKMMHAKLDDCKKKKMMKYSNQRIQKCKKLPIY